MLNEQVNEMMEECKKEQAWDIEYFKVKTKKLQDYMLNELEVDRYSVKAFKTNLIVTTMKVKKFNQFIEDKLNEIKSIVEEQRSKQQNDEEFMEGQEEEGKKVQIERTRDKRNLNKQNCLD